MMKVAIYSNNSNDSKKVTAALTAKLSEVGIEQSSESPDIVLTIGGDGTLLSAVHHYQAQLADVRFVGMHTGHLGFYTDWQPFQIDDLVASLKEDDGQRVSYPLVDVDIMHADGSTERDLALNESTVKKVSNTMVCDIYIKEQLFERFRGDGLCISTPTGSTGYNKSIGGAVMHPSLEGMQLAEIASINNRVFRTLGSPIIVGKDQAITLDLQTDDELLITCDQEQIHELGDPQIISKIQYSVSEQRISFAEYRHTHFWQRVGAAFIGDIK